MVLGKHSAELHTWVEARLSDYLDNQLRSAERAKLEQHVGDCAQCQASLESMRWTIALVKQAPAPFTKKSFVLAVPPKREPTTFAFGFVRMATMMATLLLFAIIGIDVITQMGSSAGSVAMAPAAQKDVASTSVAALEKQVSQTVVTLPTSAPTAFPLPTSASSSAAARSGDAPVATVVPPTIARSSVASSSVAPAPTKAPELASAPVPPPQVATTTTDNTAKSLVAPTATLVARQGMTGAAEISATATLAPTQTATPVPTATVAPTLVAQVVPTLAPAPAGAPQAPVPPMRIVEIGLLFLAIFFGTLMILLRRRK